MHAFMYKHMSSLFSVTYQYYFAIRKEQPLPELAIYFRSVAEYSMTWKCIKNTYKYGHTLVVITINCKYMDSAKKNLILRGVHYNYIIIFKQCFTMSIKNKK